MSERTYRLLLTGDQLLAERVHLSLMSPVTQRSIRGQRIPLIVLGGVAVVLGLLLTVVLQPVDAQGRVVERGIDPFGLFAMLIGLVIMVFGIAMPAYYRLLARRVEGRAWTYLGEDGAAVDLSAAGVAYDAGPRSMRIGWGYYDEARLLDTGLELRRRGGPVGFYPTAAFGSVDAVEAAYDDVRGWIWAAGGRPTAG